MKRILTILALVLCCLMACHKQDFTPAPLEKPTVAACDNLEREADSLEKELFSQIYYANLQLAKIGRVAYIKPAIVPIRASDPVHE